MTASQILLGIFRMKNVWLTWAHQNMLLWQPTSILNTPNFAVKRGNDLLNPTNLENESSSLELKRNARAIEGTDSIITLVWDCGPTYEALIKQFQTNFPTAWSCYIWWLFYILNLVSLVCTRNLFLPSYPF